MKLAWYRSTDCPNERTKYNHPGRTTGIQRMSLAHIPMGNPSKTETNGTPQPLGKRTLQILMILGDEAGMVQSIVVEAAAGLCLEAPLGGPLLSKDLPLHLR